MAIVALSNFKNREYDCPSCGIKVRELSCNVDGLMVHMTKCFPQMDGLQNLNTVLSLEVSELQETNRRLNRRCQQVESQNTRLNKILEAARAIQAALKGLI